MPLMAPLYKKKASNSSGGSHQLCWCRLGLTRLSLDLQRPAVQMCDVEGRACQCLTEGDLLQGSSAKRVSFMTPSLLTAAAVISGCRAATCCQQPSSKWPPRGSYPDMAHLTPTGLSEGVQGARRPSKGMPIQGRPALHAVAVDHQASHMAMSMALSSGRPACPSC